ncbi:hypothetical protein HY933_03130 [Candidatus Falkowbacteria bacterium]|nr:hypothetical protein [Candidatus Falkowbacteria bacterium]
MSDRMFPEDVFLFGHCNDTVFLVPNPLGVLGALSQPLDMRAFIPRNDPQRYQGWVFGETSSWAYQGEGPNLLVNHHRRGVLHGTLEEFQQLKQLLGELGIGIRNDGQWVPFCNGQTMEGQLEYRNMSGFVDSSDYLPIEIAQIRSDSPPTDYVALIEMFTKAYRDEKKITREALQRIIDRLLLAIHMELHTRVPRIEAS